MLETRPRQDELNLTISSAIKSSKEAALLSPFKQNPEIMAVIKYAPENLAISLIKDGRIKIIGENKVQDAEKRWLNNSAFSSFRKNLSLHFIGHLQTNKAAEAVKLFNYVDSLDSIRLARALNTAAVKAGKKLPVLIQVKLSSAETQYGIKPEDFDNFFREISAFSNLSPAGVMVIAPDTSEEKTLNETFKKAAALYYGQFGAEFNKDGFRNYFSAGMSSDYSIAVKNGSNLVRLGSLFFDNGGKK